MVELELLGVRVELPSNTPVLLLQERGGRHRRLSIFIGGPEAAAIAFALDGVDPPRPLTHDLACKLIEVLGFSLQRVVLTELRDTTFYADLHLVDADGDEDEPTTEVSARPSDAVALAVRVDAPIFATEELMAEAGYTEEAGDESPEEVLEEFQEFIENVTPDDFAS
ncbi:MAG: bifunctional nuclease family protein [Microthrixaceae bacterium]|nr:bifunctional nuclease family protein [Microthrixaceae bacterium]MCB1011460.1 bifunctional nuclease family protein [Microthrixaceae bacterium]MCB9386596.1 bifunctional nuclease family protein [Microthrixaceae bacterium]MCO5320034.1 bifunctional nuclease family protein [Microthrixaceae bacterium]